MRSGREFEYITHSVYSLQNPSHKLWMFSSSGVGRPGRLNGNGEEPSQKAFWKQACLMRPGVYFKQAFHNPRDLIFALLIALFFRALAF